ncbi:MAG TPA: hypothetical protein VMB26_15475, partial [Candidatus Binataceae bacterium]|nr:hypothetical protein [Candidatus Binataceae bacterium]
MSNHGKLRAWSLAPAQGADKEPRLRTELSELVQLGLNATGALSCVVAYSDGREEGAVQAPATPPPWANLAGAISRLKSAHVAPGQFSILRLDAADFIARQKNTSAFANRFKLLAAIATEDSSWTAVGLLLDPERHDDTAEAPLKLLSRLVSAVVTRAAHVASRDFWRDRATATAADAAAARQATSAIETDRRWIEQALKKVNGLKPDRWLEGLGQAAAELSQCEA